MVLEDNSPARQRYLSLNSYNDLNNLIENADCEDLYLECKEQTHPNRISRDVLAKTISGFSNTSGGVVIWGVETDKKDGNDVITQLLPIGNIDTFRKRVANIIPTLTTPSSKDAELKIIKKKETDSKGFLIGYFPVVKHQPTQSIVDNVFYLRSGDQFTAAPYEFIQRMFAAQDAPDIHAQIINRLLKYDDEKDRFTIPICIANESIAVGREILISVEVFDFDKLGDVSADGGLKDISSLNTGKKIFSGHMSEVLHKGFPTVMGNLYIEPGNNRKATIGVSVFADKMTAVCYSFNIYLYKNNPRFVLNKVSPEY